MQNIESLMNSFQILAFYLRPLPTSQSINPMIKTTTIIPTHTPALKMPPITSQELTIVTKAIILSHKNEFCFMKSSFYKTLQMLCRAWAQLKENIFLNLKHYNFLLSSSYNRAAYAGKNFWKRCLRSRSHHYYD